MLVLASLDPFTIAIVLSIAIGLLFAAKALLKGPKDRRQEDVITTLSTRGEYLNVVFGTRRTGYLFGWEGDHHSEDQGGGGKSLGGGGARTTVNYASGWHIIGCGSGHSLVAILSNGKAIWEGPISADDTPSGTTIEVPGQGSFTVYWGGPSQPLNFVLAEAARLGILSRWPFCFYLFWTDKNLGSGQTWPNLEYVWRGMCSVTSLNDSDFWLTDGTSQGVNGAHVLQALLTAPAPVGRGVPVTKVDNDTLESIGELAQDEHLPMNLYFEPGSTFEQAIQTILQDLGVFMIDVDGRLTFIALREPSDVDVPSLSDDVIVAPDVSREIDRGDAEISRLVFVFPTEDEWAYRDADIAFDDDSEFEDTGRVEAQRVAIDSVTHPDVAIKVARRRSQENTVNASVTVKVLRGAKLMKAGQVFDRPGFGRLRVIGDKRPDDSPTGELECVVDTYSFPDVPDTAPSFGGSPGSTPATPDIAFAWFELPVDISPGVIAIAVLRTRADQTIQGASIYISTNNVTYALTATQHKAASGGLLLDTVASHAAGDVIATGPKFEASNKDAAGILDLSGDPAGWTQGRQLAVIGSEVFYLESVTLQSEDLWVASTGYSLGDAVIPSNPTGLRYVCTTAGTSGATQPQWPSVIGDTVVDGSAEWEARGFVYQCNNMIAGRLTSTAATHAIGDRIYIIEKSRLSIITSEVFIPGETIWVKTQPFNSHNTVDIAIVTPVSGVLSGIALTGDFRVTYDGSYRVTSTGETRIVS
jgi:hypothetical protein